MLAMLASACAITSLLFAAGTAFAWLSDRARIANELSISVPDASAQEPFAALYADEEGMGTLLFDRGDDVPAEHEGKKLLSAWRGMGEGTEDFARPGARPWGASAGIIIEVASGEHALASPIHALDLAGWFRDMPRLERASVAGITPDAHAQGQREASKSIADAFANCPNLAAVEGVNAWNMEGIVICSSLFISCSSLREVDLSGLDMSCVVDANSMFWRCGSLERVDVSGWDLARCDSIHSLFQGCRSLTDVKGLSELHCPAVRNIAGLFSGCEMLSSIDLSGFGMEGNGMLSTAASMTDDCKALRYLDVSGLVLDGVGSAGSGLYPSSGTLETFIVSNRVRTGDAPVPAAPAPASPFVKAAGYWVSDETGEPFGRRGLARRLDAAYDRDAAFAVSRYSASMAHWSADDAYGAVYQRSDGSQVLIMDRGAEAPKIRDEAHLILEARDFLIDGERGSEAWRQLPISEVRICSPFAPLSCRSWFRSMTTAERIEGLELLDMSKCADVTDMLMGNGARALAVEDWRLDPQAEGFRTVFYGCERLERLDLSHWSMDAELNLGQLYSLSELTLPSCLRIMRLDEASRESAALFNDGHWYESGKGDPLTASEVIARVNAAQGTDAPPSRFSHEREDRSYAAIYVQSTGHALVFGRGLDIPASSDHGTLVTAYRGLEEQDMQQAGWMGFRSAEQPWSSFSGSILRVSCDAASRANPLKPTNMSRWFQGMDGVQHMEALEAGALDASAVRAAPWLFAFCASLDSIPSTFMRTFSPCLTDAMAMFAGCASLSDAPRMPGYAMGNVRDASRMFEGCSRLTALDLSAWDISSLRNCSALLRECAALERVQLPPAFVSPQRPDALQLTFYQCMALRQIDASDWDLSGTSTLFHAFNACHSLERILGAEDWDTARVTTMNSTFRLCKALTLDCSGWNVDAVEDSATFSFGAPGVISPFEGTQGAPAEDAIPEEALSDGALLEEEMPEEEILEEDLPEELDAPMAPDAPEDEALEDGDDDEAPAPAPGEDREKVAEGAGSDGFEEAAEGTEDIEEAAEDGGEMPEEIP